VMAHRAALQLPRHALANVGGACVEPHDGVVQGLAGLAVPQQHRLPLVSDADRKDVDLFTSWAGMN
jgi:hypothetical protein